MLRIIYLVEFYKLHNVHFQSVKMSYEYACLTYVRDSTLGNVKSVVASFVIYAKIIFYLSYFPCKASELNSQNVISHGCKFMDVLVT